MVERVLVATDGGPASDAALRWVIERARRRDLEVEIATVVDTDGLPVDVAAAVADDRQRVLDDARTAVQHAAPDSAVTTSVLSGRAAEELVERSLHKDLVVVGSNTTSPIVGIVHGTLALKVAGQSDCPTAVVPAGWHPRQGEVVVGWSDDVTADAALEFAAREAADGGDPLTIVHTWNSATLVDMPAMAATLQELGAANGRVLDDAAQRTRREHPTVAVTPLLRTGSAAVAIVRAARDASLVVVGSRGRGSVAGFFLGSVSHDVLLNMPAPVVVIPRKAEPIDVYPELVEEDV